MTARIKTFVLAWAAVLSLTAVAAAVQTQVMVQGYLTNSSGTPYTTPQTAEFRVYQGGNASTAGSGTLYYDETATVSPSASGVFNYALGSGNPTSAFLIVGGGATIPNVLAPATFDTAQPVYLEISVGGFALLPRLQLLGTPYAAIAGLAEGVKPTQQLTTVALTASSGSFTASGAGQYSVTAASGIKVMSGEVDAPAFNGTYYGDGSRLTGVGAASVAAGSVAPGLLAAGVQLPAGSLVNGPVAAAVLPSTIAYTSAANAFGPPQAFNGGLTASTVTATNAVLTATGAQYSLITSSGISVQGGMVSAPAFSGTYYGDGSKLVGVGAASVAAASVAPGLLPQGVQLPAGSVVGGPLAASVLPSSVAYTTSANAFAAPQSFPAGLSGSSATLTGGLTAASGTFTASGSGQFSLTTSSGIEVQTGMVTAPAFSGTYYGDGSKLAGVSAAGVAAANVAAGVLGTGVQLPAGSITNGPVASAILPSTVAYTSSPNVFVPPQSFPGGMNASSASFTASGNGQFSLTTSSGISVQGGQVIAPAFVGAFVGDGSRLTGVNAANLGASNVTPGVFGAGVQLAAGSLVSGPVAAGILPSTVAYTSSANTFAPPQAFPGGITAGSLEVASPGDSLTILGGVYSGPTSGYSGIGQVTSRHALAFRSWSNVAPDTLGVKIEAINKTAYPTAPWYLAQTSELHLSVLKAGALTKDDTFDEVQVTPAGLNAVDGLSTPKAVTAASATLTSSGNGQYSLVTSSGISVQGGMVSAPSFVGAYFGDGSGLTGVAASAVAAANVAPGLFASGVQLPAANLAPGTIPVGVQVPAGALTGGPLASSVLPSTVAYTTAQNAFTQPQAFPAGLTGASASVSGAVTAASATLTASGNAQYSLATSSGINVQAGMVTAPAFSGTYYGDGSKLSGLPQAVPIGGMIMWPGPAEPAGWIEADGRSLPQNGTAAASWGTFNTAALFAVYSTVWGSAGAGAFTIPDFRGMVPRGYNHGKTGSWSDPDAAARTAQYASGATGDAVGSYQQDQVRDHTHALSQTGITAGSQNVTTVGTQPGAATLGINGYTGTETREKNASVMFIVRVQ